MPSDFLSESSSDERFDYNELASNNYKNSFSAEKEFLPQEIEIQPQNYGNNDLYERSYGYFSPNNNYFSQNMFSTSLQGHPDTDENWKYTEQSPSICGHSQINNFKSNQKKINPDFNGEKHVLDSDLTLDVEYAYKEITRPISNNRKNGISDRYDFESAYTCLHSTTDVLKLVSKIICAENRTKLNENRSSVVLLKSRPGDAQKSNIRAGSTFVYSLGHYFNHIETDKKKEPDENPKKRNKTLQFSLDEKSGTFKAHSLETDARKPNIIPNRNTESKEDLKEKLRLEKKRIIHRWTDTHSWSPTRQCGIFTVYIKSNDHDEMISDGLRNTLVKKIVCVEIYGEIHTKEMLIEGFMKSKGVNLEQYDSLNSEKKNNNSIKTYSKNQTEESRSTGKNKGYVLLDTVQIVNYTNVLDEIEQLCCEKHGQLKNEYAQEEYLKQDNFNTHSNTDFYNKKISNNMNISISYEQFINFFNLKFDHEYRNLSINIILRLKSRKPTNTQTADFLRKFAVPRSNIRYYNFINENDDWSGNSQ